ncbi:MAG TPA: zinc ribbon domain-containing protein [Ktedonobacterales bacterium]
MDSTPSSPQETPGATVCAACGAPVAAAARFCGACGADILAQRAAPTATVTPGAMVAPVEAPAPPAPAAQPAPRTTFASGEGKVCAWCGAVSASDAQACVSCGAAFPTKEGDEALERAAKARIDDMQADIQRTQSKSWWPFRPRSGE